jgi:hypothetical protein
MRRRVILVSAIALAVIGAGAAALLVLGGDEDRESKAQKAAAKREREAELLAMQYPASTGVLPATIAISYDSATDRTFMTLKLAGLRVSGRGAQGVSAATLVLTSSHKGRVRPADNPEGSVDGNVTVQASSPGSLAFSGAPGSISIGGQVTPLKDPSGKDSGYSSRKTAAGHEESVRFRFPTRDLVAAAQSDGFTMSIGTVQLEIAGQALADLREFAARMNPRP